MASTWLPALRAASWRCGAPSTWPCCTLSRPARAECGLLPFPTTRSFCWQDLPTDPSRCSTSTSTGGTTNSNSATSANVPPHATEFPNREDDSIPPRLLKKEKKDSSIPNSRPANITLIFY
uniref:Putative secreted protein n=1 Tax=Ixodes ricinus TaxID=34613 RepID=A0A6B0UMS2_IXORI